MDANLKSLIDEFQLGTFDISYCLEVEEIKVKAWINGTRKPSSYHAEKLFYLLDFFRGKFPDN